MDKYPKMKILYITVRADFGGGPRHVAQLIDRLEDKYELYVACPNGEPYGTAWRHNDKIRVVDIPYRKFTFSALWKLRNIVKKEGIRIIHSHGNGAGMYSRLLKILRPKVKVVHTYHGISDTYASGMKATASIIIGRLLSPFADRYICVSNGEKKMAIERHFSLDNNTLVIYNGIDDPIHAVRASHKRPCNFVTLSRFDYQKNMDEMYRIAKAFKDDDRITFTWVGDGEDREKLERDAENERVKVTFTGFTRTPSKYLKMADWYISTSRFEGLPYGLIEAASVGLPIIASNVKGNNEVVCDKYNGFLFQTEDEAIEKIKDILDNKYDYQRLSQHSISFFRDNFTEDKMIEKLCELYKSVTND